MQMQYWTAYLIKPLSCLALLIISVEIFDVDLKLATFLYQLQGEQWLLKDHWLLQDVLHNGARQWLIVIALSLIVFWIICYISSKTPTFTAINNLMKYKEGLGYLMLTILISISIVSLTKQLTQVDCPWYITNFGGDIPYFSIYELRPSFYPDSNCFPAGHASSGYAWIGLYFVSLKYMPNLKRVALVGVILLGVVLGGVQQIRGAHFLSHDLWTLAICWTMACALSPLLWGMRIKPRLSIWSSKSELSHELNTRI